MVRYFWNPKTGVLDKRDKVAQIKKAFGDIPFFVSKPFAEAYKVEEVLGYNPDRFEGSTPPIGWKTKDAEAAIDHLKDEWEAATGVTEEEKFIRYVEEAREAIIEEEAEEYYEEDEYDEEEPEDEIKVYWIFEAAQYATGYFDQEDWSFSKAKSIFEAYYPGEYETDERETDVEEAEAGEIVILSKSGKTYHYAFAPGAYTHKS